MSAARDTAILAMYQQGATPAQIASAFDMTERAVRRAITRAGLAAGEALAVAPAHSAHAGKPGLRSALRLRSGRDRYFPAWVLAGLALAFLLGLAAVWLSAVYGRPAESVNGSEAESVTRGAR